MTKVSPPTNKTFQRNNNKLIAASYKKGIISAIHPNSNSADVSFIGNAQTIAKNIPFASSVNITKVNIGDKCKVDIFNETNQSDMVIAYTYGNTNTSYVFATGASTVTQGVTTTIPHGLGVTPNFINALFNAVPGVGTNTAQIYQVKNADATNIYLSGYNTGIANNIAIIWYAAKY